MRQIIGLMLLGIAFTAQGQKTLSEQELVAILKKYHPVAKQALLDVRIAEANVLASRGVFDPLVNVDKNRKQFEGTNYYNQQSVELNIPTWYGLDVTVGRETVKGERINPEATKGTVNYVGISVPLLQQLIFDKRRAAVQQAKIYREQSEVARRGILNDLVAEALQAYWDWWEQYQTLQLIKTTVTNAQERMAMVKTAHRLGDRPAIDTLEAKTQVQFLEQQLTEANLALQKSRLQLSVFLWSEKDVAFELPEDARPAEAAAMERPLLDTLLTRARVQPQLLEYAYKLQALNIDKRLKAQYLLPEVKAKYNSYGRSFSEIAPKAVFENNYRFGLSVAMPLRLSEARGQYQAARLKIEQTRLEQIAKEVALQNKVKTYYLEWQQTLVQYNQQQALVQNYRALQRGEEIRFANGDGSLFLINSREAKTIEGLRKEVALAAKIRQAAVRLRWAAGVVD